MTKREFSVDEANQMIPQLRSMLEQLRDLQGNARQKYEEMRDIREVGYRKDGNLIMLADYKNSKKMFDSVVNQANSLLSEIHQFGCRVTDVEMGLVDFPAVIEGKDVYLCWQLKESHVEFYHGIDEGYAGRRPLPTNPRTSK